MICPLAKTNLSRLYSSFIYSLGILFFLVFFLCTRKGISQSVIQYSDPAKNITISPYFHILEDTENKLILDDILKNPAFKENTQMVPNLGISKSTFWIKFTIQNLTREETLVLEIQNPIIDRIELFYCSGDSYTSEQLGEFQNYDRRSYNHPHYLFDLPIAPGEVQTYYLKIKNTEQLQIPAQLGSQKSILEGIATKDMIFGIYFGIVLAMFFYNIFLYFTVKDSNYIYYVIYIFTVGLTQACLQGYTFKYLWPDSQWLATQSTFFTPAFSGIAVAAFLKRFLRIKEQAPWMNLLLNIFIGCYILSMFISVIEYYTLSLQIIQFIASFGSVSILFVGIVLTFKGDRQAKLFLIAWSVFLIGICFFVLSNLGILPYNNFTAYTMQAGSAFEVILLSFALADRINVLKKEKEASQVAAFNALKENEKLILEQNLVLEKKVNERTGELKTINNELSITLKHLKETQSKLVESEKMASLGQLTAGIAHEINNPINFVSSSITPLRRDMSFVLNLLDQYHEVSARPDLKSDFEDIHKAEKRLDMPYLKEEIDSILKGIEEGASRTTEIVRGLRNFSRLDESELKRVNIHEGINSTLILLNNKLNNVTVIKNYGLKEDIECYAGKMNQVFMNILSNSVHALNKKKNAGEIVISTGENEDGFATISIKDNGTGIPQSVINKIFEPFFTTKDVGEGTGLGLSIVYSIIQSHGGDIQVNSMEGEGTEFILILPKNQKNVC